MVLTDRDEKELGLGITAHLTWQRLRRPDPWAAVQDRFSATLVDHRLVSGPHARELAVGLLAATPPTGWPPARAGLLTADHVFGALASHRLDLGQVAEQPDLAAVLRWSARPEATTVIANLRAVAGDPLVEALLAWLTERCGGCGHALGPLLREGRAGDAVPLGLIARVVASSDPGSGPRALLAREVGGHLADPLLLAWAAEASTRCGGTVSAPTFYLVVTATATGGTFASADLYWSVPRASRPQWMSMTLSGTTAHTRVDRIAGTTVTWWVNAVSDTGETVSTGMTATTVDCPAGG